MFSRRFVTHRYSSRQARTLDDPACMLDLPPLPLVALWPGCKINTRQAPMAGKKIVWRVKQKHTPASGRWKMLNCMWVFVFILSTISTDCQAILTLAARCSLLVFFFFFFFVLVFWSYTVYGFDLVNRERLLDVIAVVWRSTVGRAYRGRCGDTFPAWSHHKQKGCFFNFIIFPFLAG